MDRHLQEFLNRLGQHVEAQRKLLPGQGGNALDALTLGPRLGLQDVGLALEGGQKAGAAGFGELALIAAAAQVAGVDRGLPGFNPDAPVTQTSRQALAQGAAHPIAALDEFRNGPDTLAAWLAGAGAMAADPSNLIGLPAKGAAVAAKEGRLAGIAGAGALEASPEFTARTAKVEALLQGVLGEMQGQVPKKQAILDEVLAEMRLGSGKKGSPVLPRQELPSTATVLTPEDIALQRLRRPKSLDDIFATADKVAALTAAREGEEGAKGALGASADIYRDVQGQKAAAVKEALDEFRVGGRLPRNFKATPQYAQRVDETKTAVELLNPQGPQGRATYGKFTGALREDISAARQRRVQAQTELEMALRPEKAPITPGQADVLVGPDNAATDLGGLNRDFNAAPGGPEFGLARPTPEQVQAALTTQAAAPASDTTALKARYDALYGQWQRANPADKPVLLQQMKDAAATYNTAREAEVGTAAYRQEAAQQMGAGIIKGLDPLKQVFGVATEAAPGLAVPTPGGTATSAASGAFAGRPFAPSALPVEAKTATNPEYLASVKEQAQAVANLEPPPSMFPELDNPRGGRLVDLVNHAFKEGLVSLKEAYSRPFKRVGLKDVGSVWYGVNIQTVKNLLQDPIFARFVLRNEGVAQQAYLDNQKIIITRLTQGEKDPLALFGTLGDVLKQLGLQTETAGKKFTAETIKKLGGNPFDNEATIADELNGMQQALIGAGLQLANPVRAATGIVTAPLNLLIPMRARMFHIINNVTHVASRVAAFEQAAFPFLENSAEALLRRAAAEGKDVSALAGRDLVRGGETLAREGMFSWQEAERVLGPRYGAEWRRISEQAMEAGYKNSRDVLGNYQLDGALGAAEKAIRGVVPLQSWAWRAYPRAAKYALQHPAITAGLLHLYAVDRAIAQEDGRPGYTVGTIPVNTDTPFVGLLVNVFTPEQEGEVRFNPLSLFSPLGGDTLSIGMDKANEPETGYQKAKEVLGFAGASFNPLIQEGAYLSGQDYQAPAPGSRYSGLDLLAGDITGATAPTLAGPNKALRAGITGAMGDRQEDTFDPVTNKANELVFEQTGLPVSDPGNRALAQDIRDHGPFYQAAQRILDEGGAARAGFNAVAPVSVLSRTNTTAARQSAARDVPFSYEDIKQAQDAGQVQMVKLMQQTNEQYYAQHPAAAVNRKADIPASVDPRLAAFERENVVLKRYAPRAYATKLADYKKTLGLR